MKLMSYRDGTNVRPGVLVDEVVHDVSRLLPAGGGALAAIEGGAALVSEVAARLHELPVRLVTEVDILAPIPVPRRNLFCVGKNYLEHATEFSRSGFDQSGGGQERPTHPVVFTKLPSTVIGPDQPIEAHEDVSGQLDYEAEFAVIIGTGGRGIPADHAMNHVWGYTLANDVTARDLQRDHKQWLLGKSLDTFCPMGPWAVSSDEVDLETLVLEGRVNGDLRQKASATELIFDVPTLVATISAGITLLPGDVILTGTPAGVGIGFDPPRFLVPGDVIEITGTGLGTLRNRVVSSALTRRGPQ